MVAHNKARVVEFFDGPGRREAAGGHDLRGLFLDPNFGTRGKSIVVVGDPEHDRLSRSVFHVMSERPHFLGPLAPMIRVISQQARRRAR